jgi:hypothetical protein
MSIASTTGYSELIVYNDYERMFWIFVVYVGNALFAIGFGMMANSTSLFP